MMGTPEPRGKVVEGIKHLQTLDFVVLAGYLAAIVLIGSYMAKYVRHAKDYFVAGGSIPWWFAAISLWMSSFSALAFVTYSEIGYKYGLTALTLYWVTVPCMIIGAYLFVGRWRRARMVSPIGFIEARFSPSLRQWFVWTGFPLRFIDNSIKIYATAIFLVAAIPLLNMTSSVWITGLVIIAFSFLGGQWSVLVTDFVQFIIKVLVAFVVFFVALREVGGSGSFFAQMPADFKMVLHPPFDLYYYLTWIAVTFFSMNAGWSMIQKYNCVRSESDARKVVVGVALWNLVLPIILFAPAMFARVVMPDIPNARFSYAYISLKTLPVGMMGLMIAGLLSATLATLSNEYTMLSSVFTNDFYARKVRRDASQTHLIAVGRTSAIFIGLFTTLLAVFLQSVQGMNLFDIMTKAFGAFAPAIMAPLLAGILIRRINARGALWGIVGGFISGSVLLTLNIILLGVYRDQFLTDPTLKYWLNQGWTSTAIIINISVTVAGLWLGSVIGKTSDEERARTDEFFRQLERPFVLEAGERQKTPFPAIGVLVFFMGIGMTAVSLAVKYLYPNPGWFTINMTASGILLGSGAIIWLLSRKKQGAQTA